MNFFVFLLILLLVWFFMLAPFFKLISMSRQWKKTFTEAQQRAQQKQSNARKNAKQNTRKKKKIDPNVGEYVEFTETPSGNADSKDDNSSKSARNSTPAESQITDISWEDLPNNSQH